MRCIDTNIIIRLMRDASAKEELEPLLDGEVCINPIILYELYKGCFLSKNKGFEKIVENYLKETTFQEFDMHAAKICAEIYALLSKRGKLAPEPDMMIAAICIAHNTTLLTSNRKHFENIPGLAVKYC